MHFRRQYGDEKAKAAAREAAQVCCCDESLAQASFAKDADINEICRRFGVTDETMPEAPVDPRFYGDVSELPDLRTALENVRAAQAAFMSLPPKLRKRFDNDPQELWSFVNNPSNVDEAIELGLLRAPEVLPADQGTGTT